MKRSFKERRTRVSTGKLEMSSFEYAAGWLSGKEFGRGRREGY